MSKLNKFLRILMLIRFTLEALAPVISQDIPEDHPQGKVAVVLERVQAVVSPTGEEKSGLQGPASPS